MNVQQQAARHFREVHFGGNWTDVNLKDTLAGVSWQQAITPVHSCNTMAALVYHTGYFTAAVLQVLRGGPLDAHDKYSFDHPPIRSQQDWEKLLDNTWADADALAALVEQLPEDRLWENFAEEKYGNYFRNIFGIIEHTHYHLGQIVLIKKILLQAGE